MPTEVIGVARIDITADPSGAIDAAAKVKAGIASMSKDAQAQYQQLTAAGKRHYDSLLRQATTVGMTRSEQIAYNASLKTTGPLLDEITNRLKANAAAARSTGIEFNKYGISAKQELAALRQVPAQLTDIIVSLQGGQKPLTVLLQQGGQLRDIFGGAVPALKAMGGALLGLVNPATLSIAALAGLVVAYQKGSEEEQAFNATLITTGNAIGVTVDGLQTLAKNVGAATTGQHDAAEVINQFAKAGKVAAENLGSYAQVAIQWSQATGESTQSIVDNFTKLAKDPLKALVELDDQMHFLTAAEYEHARALDETGTKTEAAKNAQQLYANMLADRTPKMVENLGLIEKAWRGIKNETSQAISALMSIGRAQDSFQQLSDLQARLQVVMNGVSKFTGPTKAQQNAIATLQASIAGIQDQIRLQGTGARQTQGSDQERIAARNLAADRLDFLKGGRTKAQQKSDEVADENRKWKAVIANLEEGSDEYEKLYAAHQERLHQIDKKYEEKKPRGRKRTILYDSLDDLIASPDVTSRMEAIQRDYDSIANLVGDRLTTAQQKYNRELEAMGQGGWARRVNSDLQSITDKYNDIIESRRNSAKGLSDEDEKRIREAMDLELAMARQHYDDMEKAQAGWAKGASEGMANYADDAKNAFKSVGSFATKTFSEMEDTLTDFFMTSKLNATDFVNYVEKELIRLSVQQNITGPLAKSMSGGPSSFLGNLIGGVTSLFGGSSTGAAELAGNIAGLFGGDKIGAMIGALPVPSAKGNVFSGSSIAAYENMIVDRPTYFARGGNVMGEAGPEAIMPLKRGPDGRLGVQTHSQDGGNGSSGERIVVSVPITINTPDANSFRKSQNQIARQIGLASQRAIART